MASLTPLGGDTPGLTPLGDSGTAGLTPLGGTPGLTPVGGTPGLTPVGGASSNPFDWATAESTAAPANLSNLGGGGAANPFASPTAPSMGAQKPINDSRRNGLPWEHTRGDSKFTRTVKMVLFNPSEAFTKMRCEGGFGGPIGFLCLGLLAAVGATVLYFLIVMLTFGTIGLGGGADPSRVGAALGGMAAGMVIGAVVGLAFSIPMVIAMTFVQAGLLHLVLMMLGGARRGYEATFRVTCFSMGSLFCFYVLPYCIAWIPITIFYFIVMIIGLSRAHSISGGKAAIAVVAPAVPAILLFGLAFLSSLLSNAGNGF